MSTDTKFDPKVSSLEVHVADMQRHLQAAGYIVRGAFTPEERAGHREALKKRLESLVTSAQAALVDLEKL